MRRRDFTRLALAGAAGTIAAPAIVKADDTFKWRMTSFYGPNAFFYSTGPGSAKDLCKRIEEMSSGRIKIQFYGAGELIPANAGFDAVSSGTVEMNYANSYFWTGKVFAAQYFTAAPFDEDCRPPGEGTPYPTGHSRAMRETIRRRERACARPTGWQRS